MDNHKVRIHGDGSVFRNGLHYWESKGYIGHESPVHDVQMDEVGTAVQHIYVFSQSGKIRGQD